MNYWLAYLLNIFALVKKRTLFINLKYNLWLLKGRQRDALWVKYSSPKYQQQVILLTVPWLLMLDYLKVSSWELNLTSPSKQSWKEDFFKRSERLDSREKNYNTLLIICLAPFTLHLRQSDSCMVNDDDDDNPLKKLVIWIVTHFYSSPSFLF